MKKKKVLYAGDSPIPGAANYLTGILKSLPYIQFTHIPPGKNLTPSILRKNYDAILLSDFPKRNTPSSAEKMIVKKVQKGAGLLMIGGWASFSGPFGGWRASAIEKLLPVKCSRKDDRVNYAGGSYVMLHQRHKILQGIGFKNPPIICGFNTVETKKTGRVLLNAQKIRSAGRRVQLDRVKHPLLVVDQNPARRIAAFTTDFAPHWCGGLVDWGTKHRKLAVTKQVGIEVGNTYIQLVRNLLDWLVRK